MVNPLLPASITDDTTEAFAALLPGPGSLDLTPMLVTDYDSCPSELLPLHIERLQLADFLLPGTPERVVRDLCKNARTLHAASGTRFAVERVLSSLAITAQVKEWWETTPQGQPYTFSITALVSDNISDSDTALDGETQAQAVRLVRATTRASVTFDLTLGVELTSHFSVGASARAFQSFQIIGTL